MTAKINKHLVHKTFEVYENISEGDVDVIKILLGGLKSSDKTALLLLIANARLELERPQSMRKDAEYVPVSHEFVEGVGEFLRESTRTLSTGDLLAFAQTAKKHGEKLSGVRHEVNEKANSIVQAIGQELKDFAGAAISQVRN